MHDSARPSAACGRRSPNLSEAGALGGNRMNGTALTGADDAQDLGFGHAGRASGHEIRKRVAGTARVVGQMDRSESIPPR